MSRPITADEVPDQWIADIREAMRLDGFPVLANPSFPRITVKSTRNNVIGPLMLPGSGVDFTDFDQRNIVLHKLTGK